MSLRPGGIIVEATAGNTGIGLALVGNSRGYRTVIVIPETQSQEKKDMLRLCGATLYEVPALPYKDPNHYVHVAGRLAEPRAARMPEGAIWANSSTTSPTGRGTTRPPARRSGRQTGGKVDGFICAVGTGGTLAGVAHALRERRARVKIGLADPPGAALYSYFTIGELKMEGSSITEGIGQGRVTRNLEGLKVDFACQVPDAETVQTVFELVAGRGPRPGQLERHQRGGRGAPGAGARPWAHHRDGAGRFRYPLCVAALQSAVPSVEEPARAALARGRAAADARRRHRPARRLTSLPTTGTR